MRECGYIIGVARETSIMEDGREGASNRWKKLRGIIVGGEVEDCGHQEVKELGGEV